MADRVKEVVRAHRSPAEVRLATEKRLREDGLLTVDNSESHRDAIQNVGRELADDKRLVEAAVALQTLLNVQIGDDVVVAQVSVPPGTSLTLPSGLVVTLPLTVDDAEALYHGAEESALGVEGRGDVHDSNLRKSHEIPITSMHPQAAGNAEAIEALGQPFSKFDFPEARKAISRTLCPTADKVAFVPYKLVIYRKGDFFVPHVDSMSHALQFGSLSLQLPICDNDDDSNSNETASDSEADQLVFYLGRSVEAGSLSYSPDDLLRNSTSSNYRRERNDGLKVRVDLTRPLPTRDNGTVRLKYAAWLGDVPHEVGRVSKPYRAVLLYRLFKQGDRPLRIERSIADKATALLKAILHQPLHIERGIAGGATAFLKTILRLPKGSEPKQKPDVLALGVLLRHPYPPAGLLPSGLKGVDAAAWWLASQHYECHLIPVFECRQDYPSTPFRMTTDDRDAEMGPIMRHVFYPTDSGSAFAQNASGEDGIDRVAKVYPRVVKTAWIQLGFGCLVGGGSAYGNADCGADWWYRAAAMIVTSRPSKWTRSRWLFLVGERGPATMRQLYSVKDVFEQVVSFV
jgi:hypothetical protein